MTQETRILLLDDHSLFRESLSRLLEAEPGFRIVANCATASDAFEVLNREPLDIILLDFDLGEEQAPAFLKRLRACEFPVKVLMVTAGMSDADAVESFRDGVSGIFLKHRPPDQLVNSIKQVMNGEVSLDLKAVRQLISGYGDKKEPKKALTSREQLVLKAVFAGLTNKEIAVDLQISESSVKAVLQQLFAKSGVRSRSQLVRIALEEVWS